MTDESTQTSARMGKVINSLQITSKRAPTVIRLINDYVAEVPGISPTGAVINLLQRLLPAEIERARKAGGQLIA